MKNTQGASRGMTSFNGQPILHPDGRQAVIDDLVEGQAYTLNPTQVGYVIETPELPRILIPIDRQSIWTPRSAGRGLTAMERATGLLNLALADARRQRRQAVKWEARNLPCAPYLGWRLNILSRVLWVGWAMATQTRLAKRNATRRFNAAYIGSRQADTPG